MKRLFISLYVAITFGLFLITWSGEWLWQKFETYASHSEPRSIETMVTLLKPYQTLYQQGNKTDVIESLKNHQLNATIHQIEQFALLPEHIEAIDKMEPFFLYISEHEVEIYLPLNPNQVLLVGPLVFKNSHSELSWIGRILKLFAYGALAILILGWSYPLWRDLNTLKGYTDRISSGQLDIENELKPHSIVFPLGKAFEAMTRRIRELLNFQKQMMQAVSHDIRTPLARLKFSIAIAKDDLKGCDDPSSNVNVADNMLTDIAEIELLIEEVLTYGRLETAEPNLNIEQVDLYALSHHLVEKLNRNHAIQIQLHCDEHLMWMCDGYLLERALQNLLTNAQRHAEKRVDLYITNNEKGLIIKVVDDGCGIPESQQADIFTPFTRLDTSRNKASGGFGLGLAIVSKIVNWHEGQVSVSNNKTTGATFTISL